MAASSVSAPLGQKRGVAFVVVIGFITLGFYWWYWAFKTQDEMRKHTGDGLGGVLGLVIWIIISPISAFVIPSEVGSMYRSAGKEPPIGGWTGLWFFPFGFLVIPLIVWFVKVQRALNAYWESAGSAAPAAVAAPPPAAEPAPPAETEPPADTEPPAS